MPTDISTMSLGLSHSLSRHKLRFSPDKVDTMVVQAIALLDDLDKELNIYAMRVKEWYGWHFPEMAKIINDNLAYARVIVQMGMRTNASSADLAEILPEEIEIAVKAAAEVSMGTEITTEDLDNIKALAQQVVDFTEYRQQLSSYLSARMAAIAPNLTALVGDLVGARLIAHAGSLMNLAKSPASTIQILGAEKALFRALKTKHDTPKYGLIFHASLVGQATGRNKAKIARVLAAKAALGLRIDALADWGIEGEDPTREPSEEKKAEIGTMARIKIERRLAELEGKPIRSKGVAIGPNGVSTQPAKWEVKEARKYNPDADGLVGTEPAAAAPRASKKIEDITSRVEPEEPNDVEMGNGNEDEDKNGDGDKDGDEEQSEEETDATEDEEEQEETEPTTISKDTEPISHAAEPSSNGIPELDPMDVDSKVPSSDKKPKNPYTSTAPIDVPVETLAKQCGLSVTRYHRKLARGEIRFDASGKASAISKKDIKKDLKKQNVDEHKAAKIAKKEAKREKKEIKAKRKAEKQTKVQADGQERRKRKRKREEAESVGEEGKKKKKRREKAE